MADNAEILQGLSEIVEEVAGIETTEVTADKTFVDGFPSTASYDVTGVFDPGGHDTSFWAGHGEGPDTKLLDLDDKIIR